MALVVCFTAGLWPAISTPASAQTLISLEDSYERIYGELYPDEIAPFYDFYARLIAEERFALARVIGSLDEGEWGLFAALLMEADENAAFKTLQMFGSYSDAELAHATAQLKAQDYKNWQAIPVLVQAVRPEFARLALLGESDNACQFPEAFDAQTRIEASLDPNIRVRRICSEAEIAFFASFYGKNVGYVSRGVLAQEGEIPWQVQFALHGASTQFYRTADEREKQVTRFGRELEDWEINHTCGAVYLGARFVLTAAHCIGDLDDSLFFERRRVHVGSVRIDEDRNLFSIRRVLTHADFNPETLQNDIALIELTKVPTRMPYLRSVKLASAPAKASGQVPLLLSGWGFSRPANRSSDIFAADGNRQLPAQSNLLKGTVWVQPISVCRQNRNFRRRGIQLYEGQICVGSPRGVDSCRGDSGGPLVDNASGVLIGIVSGSAGCGVIGTPSVFADVGYYRDWIDRAKAATPRLTARRKHKFR